MNVRYQKYGARTAKEKKRDRNIYELSLTMALVVLNDVFEFEQEDLQKFNDNMNVLMDSMADGMDNLYTLQKNLQETYGIKVET